MEPRFFIATWLLSSIALNVCIYFVGVEEQLSANPVAADLASFLKLVDS